MGSAPKEILKFMGKQSLIDGGVEGLGGGILGFINDGTKGAIKGSIGGFVSGAVTGLISGGVSFKFQKPKVSPKNIEDVKLASKNNKINDVSKPKISQSDINTCESIKKIINDNGYSINEFTELLHADRILTDYEKLIVKSIREQIGIPSADTVMAKTIPQNDIYKYLYDNTYDGVRGFTAVKEHGSNLITLNQKYEGARLDYNNTSFKTTNGIDGISQSVGAPDKFYGTIEYKANDVSKLSIPDWEPKVDDYPYTGKAFTGSVNVVLPEYYQEARKFITGDILNVIESDTGVVIRQFKYDIKFGWITVK